MDNHGGTKAETVVKLALIFFISLFSFSVGTYVGKQVSDSDRRRVALEAEYDHVRNTASTKHDSSEGVITEAEVNELSKSFVEAEKQQANTKPVQEPKVVAKKSEPTPTKTTKTEDGYTPIARTHASKATTKSTTPEKTTLVKKSPEIKKPLEAKPFKPEPVPTAMNRLAKGKTPTPNVKPTRKPASVLPILNPTSIGKYTVQIASYATEKEAKIHAEKLKPEYFAFYVPANIKGKIWYRVSIGLFEGRKSANHFRKELLKQASISSAIVQKIIR